MAYTPSGCVRQKIGDKGVPTQPGHHETHNLARAFGTFKDGAQKVAGFKKWLWG